ncbi:MULTISPECIES: TnsA endonuclease N-terminal domain-containing protein [Lysinibacillus]|uniref:TnsA endonuclease N-terminal domain-containing protein n=1 Tax=Lysinibacillus TaxID=400634 RepID=UPI00257A79AC|nr:MULTISPECIES: TnsA endonuclease N-terminal domain-containing protein [Lysinibacillus]
MSVNKYTWTEEKIAKFYAEGRGSGELNHYLPWIKTNEIPSNGRVHLPRDWKTNRIHHLLSDLELSYFFYLEWSKKVIDIREQFPLERKKTMKIASEKGINHPFENETQTNIVMSTDFLVTIKNENKVMHIARSIKPSSELEDPRVMEKLEIERQYWEDYNVEWCLIDEKVMDTQFVKNLKYIHGHYYLNEKKEEEMSLYLLTYLGNIQQQNPEKQLITCCNEFDSLYNLEDGSAIYYVRHLFARQYIEAVNMEFPIQPIKINLIDIVIDKGGLNENYGGSIS